MLNEGKGNKDKKEKHKTNSFCALHQTSFISQDLFLQPACLLAPAPSHCRAGEASQ
jgi:hypothetical protein